VTGSQAADLSRASMMIELGRHADAARLLATLLASSPDSTRGWCLLARAQLGAGRHGEAVTAAARASALDPADDWPCRLASTALLGLHRTGAAVAAAAQARQLAPHFWRPHICLAQAAAADGQLRLAAEAAQAALAIAPDQADVHVTAGKVALCQGNVSLARQHQETALSIEPGHSGAVNELGRISLHGRDPAAAAGHFLTAARMAPGNGVFGRNTELALGRLAAGLAAPALLAAGLCAAAGALLATGYQVLAAGLAVASGGVVTLIVLRVMSVAPDARRHLARLLWTRWRRPRRMLTAAVAGRRKELDLLQGGNARSGRCHWLEPGTPITGHGRLSASRPLASPRACQRPCDPGLTQSSSQLSQPPLRTCSKRSGGALAADRLAATAVGKLAAVMNKEAARAGELVRLTRNHPERELLVRKVSSWKLKRLGDVIRIDVDRR
jgi:tetratricopeptide (TPR) repeat protein